MLRFGRNDAVSLTALLLRSQCTLQLASSAEKPGRWPKNAPLSAQRPDASPAESHGGSQEPCRYGQIPRRRPRWCRAGLSKAEIPSTHDGVGVNAEISRLCSPSVCHGNLVERNTGRSAEFFLSKRYSSHSLISVHIHRRIVRHRRFTSQHLTKPTKVYGGFAL